MLLCEKETLLIWERMAKKAYRHKFKAIMELYSEGKLTRFAYKKGCPLCEEYWGPLFNCSGCPWPNLPQSVTYAQGSTVRCQRLGSPYNKWRRRSCILRYFQRRLNTLVYLYIKDFLAKKYEQK